MNDRIITRADYMENSSELHHAYYSQFVNNSIIGLVKSRIGVDRIKDSKNEWFNDIPLKEWDNLHNSCCAMMNRKKALQAVPIKDKPGFFNWSLSDSVCTHKAAARIIKETE